MLSDADPALLAAALDGSERAARELVRRHGARLHACALRLVGDAGAAEEVVQDVFDQLLRHGDGFREESALGTWLYAVTLNRCRDVLRRASFAAARSAQPVSPHLADGALDPLERAERRDRAERINGAMNAMPADMREVIALRFASDLSYEQIAAVLECPPGTVASRLHRALRRLGQELHAIGLTKENVQ